MAPSILSAATSTRGSGVIGSGQLSAPLPDTSPGDPSAEALLVIAAQRDPACFAPLYRAYFDAVYRYCLRRVGDREAAADAAQEVFARALKALPRTQIGSFRPWLFTIAHNVITDRHRQQARRPTPVPLEAAADRVDPAPSLEEVTLVAEIRNSVHVYLAQLPADQRAIVELRLADLSGQEVAAILGKSVGSVRIAQYRAFRRLRELIDAAGDDGVRDGAH
jgi:RNA polymerase sigma-70 factor (ECF subfamily)